MTANRYPSRRRPRNEEPDERPGRDAPRSGRITQIAPQRHDPDRVSVFLDGVFAFGLSADLLLEYGLAVGLDLDDARTTEILAADEIRKATAAALQLLAYRARAEGEIAARLRQRGFSPPAIDAAMVRLRDWHYVDDADFAARWVENRQQHRPRSVRMLAHELRAKGVDATTIDETLEDAGVDEVGDARELAEKQRAKYAGLDPDVQTRRISAFLARRGYSYDVIRQALERDESEDEAGREEGPTCTDE